MASFCGRCGTQNSTDSIFCIQCGGSLSPLPLVNQAVAATPTRYGGFWIRVIAAIVDGILLEAVIFPVSFILGMVIGVAGVATHSTGSDIHVFASGVGGLFGLAAGWLYGALMESSKYQATLGKMIFGMKVIDQKGQRLTFALASGRHFAKILSVLTFFVGFIMVGFTEKKQGLHDMIAGTFVRLP